MISDMEKVFEVSFAFSRFSRWGPCNMMWGRSCGSSRRLVWSARTGNWSPRRDQFYHSPSNKWVLNFDPYPLDLYVMLCDTILVRIWSLIGRRHFAVTQWQAKVRPGHESKSSKVQQYLRRSLPLIVRDSAGMLVWSVVSLLFYFLKYLAWLLYLYALHTIHYHQNIDIYHYHYYCYCYCCFLIIIIIVIIVSFYSIFLSTIVIYCYCYDFCVCFYYCYHC